jgi:hypothetical protein
MAGHACQLSHVLSCFAMRAGEKHCVAKIWSSSKEHSRSSHSSSAGETTPPCFRWPPPLRLNIS